MRARADREARERRERERREREARERREREARRRTTPTSRARGGYGSGSSSSGRGSSSSSSSGSSSSSSSDAKPEKNEYNDGCVGPADHRRVGGSCLVEEDVRRGNHCGDPSSAQIRWRNRCSERVYTRICFERPGKSPDCGADSVAPGGTKSMWTCSSNGRYKVDAVFSRKSSQDWNCSDWHK